MQDAAVWLDLHGIIYRGLAPPLDGDGTIFLLPFWGYGNGPRHKHSTVLLPPRSSNGP
jgi:hypothetical protein